MTGSPQIGIVIPSYNDQEFLEALFDSLYGVDAGCSFLPVIVDDQSDDGSELWMKEVFQGYAIVVRPNEKAWFTRACNIGIDYHRNHIHPQFYFLLNSDTQVTAGWGRALIATSRKLDAGIVGATCLYPTAKVQHAGAFGPGSHFGINKPWIAYHEDRSVPWVTGAAMCIREDVIDRIGFLPTGEDTRQYDASDRDFCTRARLYGFEVAMSAGCVLYHYTHEAESQRQKRGEYERMAMRREDRRWPL